MKKRLSIALAAGLLVAGASVASATEMKQSFSKVLPSPNRGFTYSQHHNIMPAIITARASSMPLCGRRGTTLNNFSEN